jgi:hypothetical protein
MKKYFKLAKQYAVSGGRTEKHSIRMETFSKMVSFILIALCITVAFSCKGKDDEEPEGYKITAEIENGSSSITTVKAMVLNKVLAMASCSNSEFTIYLPVPESKYFGELDLGEDVADACLVEGFYAYNSKGNELGQIAHAAAPSANRVILAMYIYTTIGFEAIDTYEGMEFNVSCNEGWNIIYNYVSVYGDDAELTKITSQKPSGMRWLFLDESLLEAVSGAAVSEKLRSAISRKLR